MNMTDFDFNENYILEDEMVLLRPLQENDFENLISFAINEPEIWKYSMVRAGGQDGMKHYIELAIAARNAEKEYTFVVVDKRTNSYAGSTRFYDMHLPHRTLQLGYTWYGKQYQGTGLNKHCKFLMLSFAFEQMLMERVEFRADNENERSKAAMKSIGCTVEGLLRSSSYRADGSRRDSIVLSILKGEWETSVKEMLQKKLL